MKKAILMLCNNTTYLRAFINNYEQKDEDLIIINETRIGNKIKEIKDIVKNVRCIVLDNKDIVDIFIKDTNSHNNFIDEYTMGGNILQQWYVFKYLDYEKVIVLDDDVLINNINKVFEYDTSIFYKFALSAGAKEYNLNSSIEIGKIKAFGEIFDIDINKDNYKEVWVNNHINAGQRMYIRKEFNIDLYEKYLIKFFNNNVMRFLWFKRNKPGSYYLDEWFESMFAYKTGITNDILREQKLAYIEIRNDERVDFTKYDKHKTHCIWHNATCSHKLNWLQKLKENDLIK